MDKQQICQCTGPSEAHRTVHGTMLAILREGLGVSQEAFAATCGHAQAYQARLERPGRWDVPAEKAGQIEAALAYYQNAQKSNHEGKRNGS